MKTFRDLTYALTVLCITSVVFVIMLSHARDGSVWSVVLSVNTAVFSVSLVALIASFVMYFHSKNLMILVLKRRGGRAYGELLQHKMRLIDVMDDAKGLVDWERILYSDDEFQRIKKFLYEEYFLLLSYEPFLSKTPASESVCVFYDMHKELENFMRSVAYDRIEYNKFKRMYWHVWNMDVTPTTPEENFLHPELQEAYSALYSANEYALFNVDHLLTVLGQQIAELDKYFQAGVPWETAKASFDAEFRLWMHAKD